jgi:hypothetical protein
MKYAIVMPFIYKPWADACLASCKLPVENILAVDNTVENRGVAASWNLGIEKMKVQDADWLIILSAAIRFGEKGGHDFIQALENHPECAVIEAAMGIGWHLIAFSKKAIELAGKFDENFYPAYYEDLDYSWRLKMAYEDLDPTHNISNSPIWHKEIVDVMIAGFAHGVTLGGVRADTTKLVQYYIQKWGGETGRERFMRPFNNVENLIKFWPHSERGGEWI